MLKFDLSVPWRLEEIGKERNRQYEKVLRIVHKQKIN